MIEYLDASFDPIASDQTDVQFEDREFAYFVSRDLPESIDDLDDPLASYESYHKFVENDNPRYSGPGLRGIVIVAGYDTEREYDRDYCDLTGYLPEDALYYVDIYEVGNPGHNTIAFVGVPAPRLDDPSAEYALLQAMYDRAAELFRYEFAQGSF